MVSSLNLFKRNSLHGLSRVTEKVYCAQVFQNVFTQRKEFVIIGHLSTVNIDLEIELVCFDFGNLPQNFCKLVTLLKAKLTIKRFLYE